MHRFCKRGHDKLKHGVVQIKRGYSVVACSRCKNMRTRYGVYKKDLRSLKLGHQVVDIEVFAREYFKNTTT